MSVLTWRDTASPQFTTSPADYARIGSMLKDAFGGLSDGLGKFDQLKSDAVNNGILMQLSKLQDPAAAEAAIQDGSIFNIAGPKDAYRVNADTIKAVTNRPTELLDQVGKQLSNDQTSTVTTGMKADQAYTAETRANEVAAAPLYAAMAGIKVDPNKPQDAVAARQAILADPQYAGVVSKLHPDQITNLIKFGNDQTEFPVKLKGDVLGNEGSQITNNTNQFNLTEAKSDAANRKAASTLYAHIASIASNPDEARTLLAASKAPGEVQALVLGMLSPQFPGMVGTADLGGAPISGADAYNTVVGNGAYGPPPPRPLSTMPISGVIDYGRNVLIPGTKAKGVGVDPKTGKVLGSSAVGIYQITGSTLQQYAPQVLGDNWQSQTFSPEVQDKIGARIYANNRGSVSGLRSQWASLKRFDDAQVAAIGRMGWDRAKAYIAQGESGGTPAATPNTFGANETATALTDVSAAQGQRGANTIGPEWFASAGDKRDVGTVADELRTTGPFKGTAPNYLIDHLVQIMDATGGTAAQAAVVLKHALTGGHAAPTLSEGLNLVPRLIDYVRGTPNLPGGRKLDSKKLTEAISEVTSGEALGRTEGLNQLGRGASDLATAQAKRNAIAQTLATARQRYNNGDRRLGHTIITLQSQLNDADAQVQSILQSKRSNPDNGYIPKNPAHQGNDISGWSRVMNILGF